MLSVVILVRSFVVEKVDVIELEANLFANRLLYSPNGISFVDENTGRAYPGIIDFKKFGMNDMENKLLSSIYYGDSNRNIGAKITFKNFGSNEENLLFYNKKFYDEKKILIESGLTKGPGGATSYTKKLNVLIFKNSNSMDKGLLELDIIMPNS